MWRARASCLEAHRFRQPMSGLQATRRRAFASWRRTAAETASELLRCPPTHISDASKFFMQHHREMPPLFLRPQFEKVLLWILRSPLRVTAAVLMFGVSASLIEGAIHLAVRTVNAPLIAQATGDAVVIGIFAAFFGLVVLTAARNRHHKVQDDLRRIAELNHQVRNALQVIVYGEYSPNDASHRSAVLEGVEKIQAALRELFPLVGERTDDRPWEAHNPLRLQGHSRLYERRRQQS